VMLYTKFYKFKSFNINLHIHIMANYKSSSVMESLYKFGICDPYSTLVQTSFALVFTWVFFLLLKFEKMNIHLLGAFLL
ncbi:hypothetical protein VIGAN_03055900, partial [Vigna angularis var. angularis]